MLYSKAHSCGMFYICVKLQRKHERDGLKCLHIGKNERLGKCNPSGPVGKNIRLFCVFISLGVRISQPVVCSSLQTVKRSRWAKLLMTAMIRNRSDNDRLGNVYIWALFTDYPLHGYALCVTVYALMGPSLERKMIRRARLPSAINRSPEALSLVLSTPLWNLQSGASKTFPLDWASELQRWKDLPSHLDLQEQGRQEASGSAQPCSQLSS